MHRTQKLLACTAAFAALSLFVTTPAAAHDTQQTARVSYADLNLNSEAGARAMLQRIEAAAERVCGDRSGPMPISQRRATRACVAETMGDTVAALHAPVVTAMHDGQSPAVVIAAR